MRFAGPLTVEFARPFFALCVRGGALLFAWGATHAQCLSTARAEAMIGLPFTRNYSLDEIGDVSRSARLGFDRLGRLAVIGDGCYVVLNDNTWLDLAYKGADSHSMTQIVPTGDGRSYYGTLASWGEVEYTPEGWLRPRSMRPARPPQWVMATNFNHVVVQDSGIYFGGFGGVVYWDRQTGEQSFFEVPGVANVFALDQRVFISSHVDGVCGVNEACRTLHHVAATGSNGVVIDCVAALSGGRALVSTTGRRLLIFDGENFSRWPGPLGDRMLGRISCLQRLIDGGVAVAIDGKGLYLVSDDGEIRLALTSSDYHRISDLVTREAGVLWVAAEGTIQKLHYGNSVAIVDQRLGVSISWPQVVQYHHRIVIASHGRLYEAVTDAEGLSTRFELMASQPGDGVWGIASSGSQLLVGNAGGAFVREGSKFTPVLSGFDSSRLVMVAPDFCYAIGAAAITALRWDGERWTECAPRVPGVGFPAIVHAARGSAWIELGANRAARVSFSHGRLQTRVFDRFPWITPSWVNVGVVGSVVVLSGPDRRRLFFDEDTGDFCAAPQLQHFLNDAPYPISRIREDGEGTLWASHEHGIFRARRTASGFQPDHSSLATVRERHAVVQFTAPGHAWISTGTTLYHVTENSDRVVRTPLQPFLVAVSDGRSGTELFSAPLSPPPSFRLPYAQNNLSFRFFAGGYSSIRAPSYEFTLTGDSSAWSTRSTDSLLALHNLEEGDYRLSAQLLNASVPEGAAVELEFTVEPPWYRSSTAYTLYWASGILGCCGLIAAAVKRTRRKNVLLEKLVRERTEELRSTMAKLEDETRNAATLAERNRLAGEIHDSLQQGLSGLMLQLDATLKLPDLAPDVRSRLAVARKMVSFTRHEVQQAVWDLESPWLENADLVEALKKMAALISAGAPQLQLDVSGAPPQLSSSTKHHLLRIAQEAITNAVRHGEAGHIGVHLCCTESAVALEVSDDGRGFEPRKVFADGIGHFGLRGLRGRASKIGGELEILSERGSGTTVRLVLPLTAISTPRDAALHAN